MEAPFFRPIRSVILYIGIVLLTAGLTLTVPALLHAAEGAPDPAANVAKEKEKETDKADATKTKGKDKDDPKDTTGSVTINGQEIKYRAKTGTMAILKEDGTERARIFYVAYSRLGENGVPLAETAPAQRSIMFCFNGGPGASSVWLHFGGLGPKRVDLPADGLTPRGLASVVDNPNSILDATDLVFVDPVGTGLSRAAKGEKPEQFQGVEEDIESVGEFVRMFVTRENRWISPKYLCGESYGAIRVSGLAGYLQEQHAMYPKGVLLVSGLLNFQTLLPEVGNDLPFITFLPGMAATAHYHGMLSPEMPKNLDDLVAAAQAFARTDYAQALLSGRVLEPAKRRAIAERVAAFTGLSVQLVEDSNLRVSPSVFREHLLRGRGLIVGRFDGRITSRDADRISATPEFDPALAFIIGAFSSATNAYVRSELKFESDLPYRILAPIPWNYSKTANRYLSMENRLADAMKENPEMRLLVAVSERDLAVPPDAMLYSVDHLPIPDSLRTNIVVHRYASGHMMYLYDKDAALLRRDLVDFLAK